MNLKLHHPQIPRNQFQTTRETEPNNLFINEFEVVSEYKYLGHIILDNLSDVNDVKFRLNSFYGKFNWVYRNFKNTSVDVLYFLFKSFCTPEYGITVWSLGEIASKPYFKTFMVAYSNSLKRILNVPISSSSHGVAEIFNDFLFNHLVNFSQVRYFKRILKSFNPVLKILSVNIKNGYLYKFISKSVGDRYNCDILLNDLDALRSRVLWVQNHEPRTGLSLTVGN